MQEYNQEFSKIKRLLRGRPRGMTIKEISEELGSSRNSVAKYLDIMSTLGVVERKDVGRAKVYALAAGAAKRAKKRASRGMFDDRDDGIVVLNMRGEVVCVNPAFEDISGYAKEDLVGESVVSLMQTLMAGGEVEPTLAGLGSALKGKVPPAKSKTIITADGRKVRVRIHVSILKDEKGTPCYIVAMLKSRRGKR